MASIRQHRPKLGIRRRSAVQVSGRELTSNTVMEAIRNHKKESFNIKNECCVCYREDPPVVVESDSEEVFEKNKKGEVIVNWVECSLCNHWAHEEGCVPEKAQVRHV